MKHKKNKKQFRQGDVLIERVEETTPKDAKWEKGDRVILAHGEVTGHAHEVAEPQFARITEEGRDQDSALATNRLMKVTRRTEIRHQEHAPIPVTRGTYKITRQREYSPEAIRNVAD